MVIELLEYLNLLRLCSRYYLHADWLDTHATLAADHVVARLLLCVWDLLLLIRIRVCAPGPPPTFWLIVGRRVHFLTHAIIDIIVPLLMIVFILPQFELGWKHNSLIAAYDLCGCHSIHVVVHNCLYRGTRARNEFLCRLFDCE